MSPAEWHAVKQLFDASLEASPELRASMLAEADVPESIRAEAVRLLANHDLARESFLNAPEIVRKIADGQNSRTASLIVGERLGPYEIVALIGLGGMGEVYKARDTRLNRIVALKVSKAEFSKRFEREARAAAALNHPHICQLHDVGPNYLVMEFVDGGPIAPTTDVLTLLDQAMQMADGMMAAHALGITHRDLKPGNILVTRQGSIKILDFGLALVASPSETGDADAALTMDLTDQGIPIGTVPYMSPEQANGQKVDARSDLWSLGVILYEMATGTRPFQGTTAAVVFKEILSKEAVPVRERNPNIPAALESVILRLLQKDREARYQSAADVRTDLLRVDRASSSTGMAASPAKSRPWPMYAVAGVAASLVIGGVAWLVQSRLKINPPPGGKAPIVIADVGNQTDGNPPAALTSKPEQSLIPKPLLTSKDILAVADFDNRTGDPVFDGTLREALASKLEQSNLLLPMSTAQVRELLTEAKRDINTPITADLANELCVRAGEKASLSGMIAALGSNYVLLLKATDCQKGKVLASAQAEARGKEKVMTALSLAVDSLREKLGESLSKVGRPGEMFGLPVTTASLEAYQEYAAGREQVRLGALAAAIPHFQRAREIDPNFVMAWNLEASLYFNVGQPAVARPLLDKAYSLREHASRPERLALEGNYYSRAGDIDKSIAAWEECLRVAPRSSNVLGGLANTYRVLGEFERAAEIRKRQMEVAPFDIVSYQNLMIDYINSDRFAEAKAVAEMPFPKKVNAPIIHAALLRVAYYEGDLAAAEKEQALLVRTTYESAALINRMNYLVNGGKFSEAEALIPTMQELGLRTKAPTLGKQAINILNWGKAAAGDCQAPYDPSAELLLVCGENERVAALSEEELNRPDVSTDTAAVNRALVALAKHQPQSAISALSSLRRGQMDIAAAPFRGLAYMELNKPAEAASEFRKLISHKSQSLNFQYALEYVQLARALAAAGKTAEAKKAYDAFFNLWKDADPGIPLLEVARKEYAALR